MAGNTTVNLPADATVDVDARVVGGQICVNGKDVSDGLGAQYHGHRATGRADPAGTDHHPARASGLRPDPDRRSGMRPMTAAVATYQYRTSRVAVGTFFLLLGAAFLLDSLGVFRVTAALFWPLFVISLGAGLLLHRARRMQVEEDRSAQLAVAEERVRIARELHDIVAHGVSLMTIQIAAARRVGATKPRDRHRVAGGRRADRPPDPQRARRHAGRPPGRRRVDRGRGRPPRQRRRHAAAARRSPISPTSRR